ncbi:MAG: arginase family protein [Candidatus Hodarchaeales archaeon]
MKNIEFSIYEPEMLCGIIKKEWEDDNENYHLLGVPIDISSSYRTGARKGPDTFRQSLLTDNYECVTENQFELEAYFRIKDWGNTSVFHSNLEKSLNRVTEAVEDFLLTDYPFLVLGGDHSTTIGVCNAFEKRELPYYIAYFDAHLDLYDVIMENPLSHACTLRRLSEGSSFQGASVFGYRDFTKDQIQYSKTKGIKVYSTNDLVRKTDLYEFGLNKALEISNQFDNIYLSLDLDVLDPTNAPGVGNPVAGGLSTRELIWLITGFLKGIKDSRLIGWDIVEFCPSFDVAEITSFTMVKLLIELLGAQIYV